LSFPAYDAHMNTAANADAQELAKFSELAHRWWDAGSELDEAPVCDVVVCHHVVYNVPDIAPFLRALASHATRRVVVELPVRHPLTWLNPLWKHFWDLDRPTDPTADDLVACAREVGLDPTLEVWVDAQWGSRVDLPRAERVAMARTRVCLTPDRDPEVADFLAHMPESPERRVATLWWDVG